MALPCLRPTPVPSPSPKLGKLPPLPRRRAVVIAAKPPMETSRNHQPHLKNAISRRDVMVCTAASLVANFFVTEPADAGRIKPETMRKIREKLDKLREKAGFPKKEADSSAGDKEKPPVVLNKAAGPVVEATF